MIRFLSSLAARQLIWAAHHRTPSEIVWVPAGTRTATIHGVSGAGDLGAPLRALIDKFRRYPSLREEYPGIPADSTVAVVPFIVQLVEEVQLSTWFTVFGQIEMGFGPETGACVIAHGEVRNG